MGNVDEARNYHHRYARRPLTTSSGCWGSVNGSPAVSPGSTEPPNDTRPQRRHQLIRMPRCAPGCAPTPRIIRAVGSGPPITTPAGRAGQSITKRSNDFGASTACGRQVPINVRSTCPSGVLRHLVTRKHVRDTSVQRRVAGRHYPIHRRRCDTLQHRRFHTGSVGSGVRIPLAPLIFTDVCRQLSPSTMQAP